MKLAAGVLALLVLAACVDFVDPVGLGLARDTRVELAIDLTDNARNGRCPGPTALPADSAVLCFQATLVPGVNRLGERLRVVNDTIRVMGMALLPLQSSDSLLLYEHRFTVPLPSLNTIPLTAVLPGVEGVDIQPREIRWFAATRADPDTVVRAPGTGARLQLRLPGEVSTPRPSFQYWTLDVAGDTAVASYRAYGVPLSAYDFPSEVLAALGGTGYVGQLRWHHSFTLSAERLQVAVRLDQRLGWTILTR